MNKKLAIAIGALMVLGTAVPMTAFADEGSQSAAEVEGQANASVAATTRVDSESLKGLFSQLHVMEHDEFKIFASEHHGHEGNHAQEHSKHHGHGHHKDNNENNNEQAQSNVTVAQEAALHQALFTLRQDSLHERAARSALLQASSDFRTSMEDATAINDASLVTSSESQAQSILSTLRQSLAASASANVNSSNSQGLGLGWGDGEDGHNGGAILAGGVTTALQAIQTADARLQAKATAETQAATALDQLATSVETSVIAAANTSTSTGTGSSTSTTGTTGANTSGNSNVTVTVGSSNTTTGSTH